MPAIAETLQEVRGNPQPELMPIPMIAKCWCHPSERSKVTPVQSACHQVTIQQYMGSGAMLGARGCSVLRAGWVLNVDKLKLALMGGDEYNRAHLWHLPLLLCLLYTREQVKLEWETDWSPCYKPSCMPWSLDPLSWGGSTGAHSERTVQKSLLQT